MVSCQMLSELEEVIQYKLVPERRDIIRETWWERLQVTSLHWVTPVIFCILCGQSGPGRPSENLVSIVTLLHKLLLFHLLLQEKTRTPPDQSELRIDHRCGVKPNNVFHFYVYLQCEVRVLLHVYIRAGFFSTQCNYVCF